MSDPKDVGVKPEKRRGRPKLTGEHKRGTDRHIKFTEAEDAHIRSAVDVGNFPTVSDFIREATLNYADDFAADPTMKRRRRAG